jgi:hypothetical protein
VKRVLKALPFLAMLCLTVGRVRAARAAGGDPALHRLSVGWRLRHRRSRVAPVSTSRAERATD